MVEIVLSIEYKVQDNENGILAGGGLDFYHTHIMYFYK